MKQRIEEARRIWELEAMRLVSFVECQAPVTFQMQAVAATKKAYEHWKEICKEVCES